MPEKGIFQQILVEYAKGIMDLLIVRYLINCTREGFVKYTMVEGYVKTPKMVKAARLRPAVEG
jgi:hypothetical protein